MFLGPKGEAPLSAPLAVPAKTFFTCPALLTVLALSVYCHTGKLQPSIASSSLVAWAHLVLSTLINCCSTQYEFPGPHTTCARFYSCKSRLCRSNKFTDCRFAYQGPPPPRRCSSWVSVAAGHGWCRLQAEPGTTGHRSRWLNTGSCSGAGCGPLNTDW